MKSLRIVLALLVIAFVNYAIAFGAEVEIQDIVSNEEITGRVTNVPDTDLPKYKVVVYVHTNKWYIHPYETGGPGKSYAVIRPGGSWTIETVLRDVPADKMAAILVKEKQPVPNQTTTVKRIPRLAIQIRKLAGTRDEGKL